MTCQNCSRRRFSGGSRNRKRSASVPARHCLFSDLPQKAYRLQEIFSREREDAYRVMTEAPVTIQITPTSLPSMPTFLGEVAAFAQVLAHIGILKTIQDQ